MGDVSGRTVLVTGGAGFVGSHIADALVADNEVRVLDDFSSGSPANVPSEADVIEGDIRDSGVLDAATEGIDLIFHQAGLVSVTKSVERPRESHAINADATIDLLECARRGDARVVLASSSAIYGHPESVPICESDPKEPTSPYGADKLTLDHYARLYADLYDLETVPLRYFNVYGPRQSAGDYSGVIAIFLDQARRGEPITIEGDGTQTRDFVHVSDVVRANLLAATTDEVGLPINVGTGRHTSILELAEAVREVVGSDSELVHVDPRPGDIEHSCADVSRARRVLGFEPRVELDEGLATLVA